MMKRIAVAVAALAVGGMFLSAGSEAKSCVMAGGKATMITMDLAKFMAEAALKNSINGMNAQPAGKIDLVCSTEVLSSCVAKQKACKS